MPIDDVIGNYVITYHKNPRTLLANKTLIVAFLIPKFILSDPKMILHKFEKFGREMLRKFLSYHGNHFQSMNS